MASNALYRRFRPTKFSELMGQEYITKILKNQIKNNRLGHAYLFSGSRGTGKTSTAKIFSRAINCLNPKDCEPCNECEICKGILSSRITDVVEMDAASNNGVDNIRDIREEVVYLPTQAKYKVYIIDEVHMLSPGAFNALLKTLEEPPENVIFILATTESHKLPVTILSRLQRFEFGKLSEIDIVEYLNKVLKEIEVESEEKALKYIAYLADGGMRDALSILERCLNDVKEILTYDNVREILGISSIESILLFLEAIAEYDTALAINVLEDLIKSGKDLRHYADECVKVCIDILIFKSSNKLEHYSAKEEEEIRRIESKVDISRLNEIIQKLSEIDTAFRQSTNPVTVIKAKIVALCAMENDTTDNGLIKRIEELEKKIKEGVTIQEQTKDLKQNSDKIPNFPNETKETKKLEIDPKKTINKNEDKPFRAGNKEYLNEWIDIKKEISKSGKMKLFAALVQVDAYKLNENEIGLTYKTEYAKKLLEDMDNINIVKKAIFEILGKEYNLTIVNENNDEVNKPSKFETMFAGKNINYIIEEE